MPRILYLVDFEELDPEQEIAARNFPESTVPNDYPGQPRKAPEQAYGARPRDQERRSTNHTRSTLHRVPGRGCRHRGEAKHSPHRMLGAPAQTKKTTNRPSRSP